jgi:hypothetical protein
MIRALDRATDDLRVAAVAVMLVLRGLAAFIATIPWPTLRRCQHKWSPRTYPWACEHCGGRDDDPPCQRHRRTQRPRPHRPRRRTTHPHLAVGISLEGVEVYVAVCPVIEEDAEVEG